MWESIRSERENEHDPKNILRYVTVAMEENTSIEEKGDPRMWLLSLEDKWNMECLWGIITGKQENEPAPSDISMRSMTVVKEDKHENRGKGKPEDAATQPGG